MAHCQYVAMENLKLQEATWEVPQEFMYFY